MTGWTSAVVGVTVAKLLCALAAFILEIVQRHGHLPPNIWLSAGLVVEFSAIASLLIWQSRGGDERARLLGITLLLVAAPFADPVLQIYPNESSGLFQWLARTLPFLRMDAWLPAFFWLFASRFPEGLTSPRSRRWTRMAVRCSLGLGALLFTSNLIHVLFRRHADAGWLKIFDVPLENGGGHYWTVLLLAAMPVWPFLMWRAQHSLPDQRRRIMVFVGGLTLGLLPVTIEVLLETLIPRYGQLMQGPAGRWSAAAIYVSLATTPIVTAYSVLVDRVLDVRLFLRVAVQYSLARLTILAAIFVPFAALTGYVYWRRDQTLTHILTGLGPFVLLALTLTGLLALTLRERMILALDRRFFREGYDARVILRKLADEPRRSMDLRDLVSHVTTEIDRALHLQSIAMLVADERTHLLRSLDGRVRPLPIASRLAAFFAEDQSPLEIDLESSPSSLLRGLPPEERQWLADAAARLLLPIVGSDGSLLGLVALGEKRSELAFSRDDQALLAMIQGSLALSLENRRLRSSPSRSPGLLIGGTEHSMDDAAVECSDCWSVHQPETTACPCGGKLRPAPVPYVLLGKFRFDKRIGAGGMGVVYRAVDLALDRHVAIKTLPQVSPEYAGRLRREARAMAVVSHPSLALIYGAEMWHGTPMLVCEYLGGGTLADRLRIRRLPSEEALDLGLVMADVLEHLHGVGIVHCDIKPSNIGYMVSGSPKLLDFGLARLATDTQRDHKGDSTTRSSGGVVYPTAALGSTAPTDSRHFIGTPLYMCPEAINREPPSALYDLWSLTVVLFEAIAGTPPFKGRAVLEILEQVNDTHRPDIREFQPDCSASIAEFFTVALARDRGARPQTAQALRKALLTLRTGLQRV